MKFIRNTAKALLLAGVLLGLGGCDQEGEDVMPQSFSDFQLYTDEVWDYVYPGQTSLLRLDPLHNDSIKLEVNVSFGQPKHGAFVLENDGFLYYQPNEGYVGADSMSYTVCSTKQCKTEKLKIYLEAGPEEGSCSLNVINDAVVTNRNQWVDIKIHHNDIICTPYSLDVAYEFPNRGHWEDISYSGPHPNNKVFRYYPPKDYTGQDTFKYKVFDNSAGVYREATVTITIQ